MAKQVVAPKTQIQSENMVRVDQRNFGRMMNDPPASEIGDNVAYSENMILFPTRAEGRKGSRLWSSTDLPYLRNGLTAYRVGNVVTRVNGPEFVPGDIYGRYIVWPDGDHDEIIGFNSADEIITRQIGNRDAESGCWIRTRVFGCFFHRTSRQIIIHIDSRFFITGFGVTQYTEIQGICAESPGENKTYFYEDDDYVYAINQNGIFKIRVNVTANYYWKVNSPVIDDKITGVIQTEERTVGRRYVASMVRMINGTYHGTRTGDDEDDNIPLLTIEQETGTTKWDQNALDYGEVFTQKDIGLGNETYGVLTCDLGGVGLNEDLNDWRGINNGTFRIEMNSEGVQEVMVDFTNIISLEDVATFIQNAVRQHWPSATVKLEKIGTGRSRLVFSTGKIDGSTIDYLLPGEDPNGTDISDVDAGTGCGLRGIQGESELDNSVSYTEPSIIGDLVSAPRRDVTPITPQTHFTHFGVHGTKDSGPAGTDPLTGAGNNPEIFIHIDDVPIMKAFTASEAQLDSPRSLITLNTGLFSQHDIGNVVLYENGQTSTIEYLSDASGNRVYTMTSIYAVSEDGGTRALQSAGFGSATILTCSKSGNLVTRDSGARGFTASDVRKPIFWADGTIDWIIEVVSTTQVRTLESSSTDKPSQGVVIDPTSRKFCDISTDFVVASRQKNFTTEYRFFRSLPEVDLGVIVQGFLAVAIAGENTIYYSPMAVAKKYLVGYYNPAYQYDNRIEDEITFLMQLPDKLAVMCTKSAWVTATNTPRSTKIPAVGIQVALLPFFTLVDNIGCVHVGSIRKIDIGVYSMVTSEPSHRFFDGFKFTENLAFDQVMNTIERLSAFTFSHYNDIEGLRIWGAREQ